MAAKEDGGGPAGKIECNWSQFRSDRKGKDMSKNRGPAEAPPSPKISVPALVKICPSLSPSVELEFFKYDVFTCGNRWLCRLYPCSSSATNGPRFKKVYCLRNRYNDF